MKFSRLRKSCAAFLAFTCLLAGTAEAGGVSSFATQKIPHLAFWGGPQNHAYYVFPPEYAATYEEALACCRSYGGYLAVINNIKENRFVYTVMRDMGYGHAYIGLTFGAGKWKWTTGEKLGFQNWKDGVKDPAPRGNEKYAMLTYAPPVYVLPDGTVTGERPEADAYEFLPDASCAWSRGAFDEAGGSPFICEWGD